MSNTFVIMTAMPPTTGHMSLIDFAVNLGEQTTIIVHTNDDEPYAWERVVAICKHVRGFNNCKVVEFNKKTPEDPSTPGFRDYWTTEFRKLGFKPGDTLVGSEMYGEWLAQSLGGTFLLYDIDRVLDHSKATRIREDYIVNFAQIAPEFQPHLRRTVTLFGAESVGKTTTSRLLSKTWNGHWMFEYARPYLEAVGPEITADKMHAIWKGQMALQRSAREWRDKPFIFQDTDLFSTLGYWRLPHWHSVLGDPPPMLEVDAITLRSDLYIILKSDSVPFEPDPLRYGGDKRESSDQYWIDLAEQYNLNYVVASPRECLDTISDMEKEVQDSISYDRKGF